MGAELLHADRRTDMTKLIVAFRNFANAPKKCLCFTKVIYLNNSHKFLTKEKYDSDFGYKKQ